MMGPSTAGLMLGAAISAALLSLSAGLLLLHRQARTARRIAVVRRIGDGTPSAPVSRPAGRDVRALGAEPVSPPSWFLLLATDAAGVVRLQSLLASPLKAGLMAVALLAVSAVLLDMAGFGTLQMVILSPVLSILVARLLLRRAAAREEEKFKAQLPDAIALMVRGIRAGVPVTEAVAEVGREFPAPVGPAFRGAHEQVRLGQPLEGALWAVAARVRLPEMNFLCVTVAVQRETGGNLGETLSQLEGMIRKRAALQLKVRALSSEARASALIIGALPLLMAAALFVMAPDYVAPLIETGPGRLLMATAAACLVLGGLVMVHIVRSQA